MKIGIGNDHAAVDMKNQVVEYLEGKGYEVVNFGTDTYESCNYPEYGEKVGRAVAAGDVDLGILIHQLLRDYRTDNLALDILTNSFQVHAAVVLGGNHHRFHTNRAVIAVIFHCDLAFAIRPQVSQAPFFPHLGKLLGKLMGQGDRQGHQLRGFVAGIAKHHSLVPGADLVISVSGSLLYL